MKKVKLYSFYVYVTRHGCYSETAVLHVGYSEARTPRETSGMPRGSYFVMDKDGIKWAVKRLKEQLIEKYTKKIDDTRLRLTTLLLEDYIFISKY